MFKAKIVLNNNGKQTVLEFDNEKEYYDYLESHPEVNQTFNWNTGRPSVPFFGGWNWADEFNKLVDQNTGRRLGYNGAQDNARALVKRDLQRMEREEKQKEREAKEAERQKEQRKQDLSDAKQLLSDYTSRPGHNPEYAKRLEEEIEQLNKKLKA